MDDNWESFELRYIFGPVAGRWSFPCPFFPQPHSAYFTTAKKFRTIQEVRKYYGIIFWNWNFPFSSLSLGRVKPCMVAMKLLYRRKQHNGFQTDWRMLNWLGMEIYNCTIKFPLPKLGKQWWRVFLLRRVSTPSWPSVTHLCRAAS